MTDMNPYGWRPSEMPGPWHSGDPAPGAFASDAAPAAANYDWLAGLGLGFGAGGAILDVVGVFTHLKAQQGEFKAAADNAAFASNQANIRARGAEQEAEQIIEAGQRAASWRGAQNAHDTATLQATAAASGVELTGSVADVQRALRINAEVDKRTIRTNSKRRAAAVREAAANERVGSLLGRASAQNLRSSAGSISPAAGAIGATMSGAGSLIGQYLAYHGRR